MNNQDFERIKELKQLLDNGDISQYEFDNAKNRIMYGEISQKTDDRLISSYKEESVHADNHAADSKSSLAIIIAITAVVIMIGVFIFAVTSQKTNTEDYTQEYTQDDTYDEYESDYDDNYSNDYSGYAEENFVVDDIYYVQTPLRVREEPGTGARWLKRYELTSEDFSNSTDTEHAVLEKGAPVTCYELSGNWMRISSGWVCCYDGEVLVR